MKTLYPGLVEEKFSACIGIDWGDKGHVCRILDCKTGKMSERPLEQRPNILQEWVVELQQRFPDGKIAIAIEQSKGAVINFLMKYDFFEIFIVNPKLSAKYREAFKSSGAKDDKNDSGLLLDILMRHRERLKILKLEDDATRALQILTPKRRDAIKERTRLSNQLKAILKQYYPLALEVAGENLYTVMACNFIQRWPTLEKLQNARLSTIRDFYTRHGLRQQRVIDTRLKAISSAKPLTTDKVIIETSVLEVNMLTEQLIGIIKHIDTYDEAIEAVYQKHPDKEIFSSFPGAGKVFAPRLLSAFGSFRDRYNTSMDVNNFNGISPVTVQSGKKRIVRWRWACPKFHRQSFHEFAGESRRHSIWADAYYTKQRDEGKSHNAAVRALAFKWVRILFRCWKNRVPYDEVTYLNALRKNGACLVSHVAVSGVS